MGSVKTEGGRWRSRAALSAAYPEKLGLAWGLAVSLACARLSRKVVTAAGVKTAELPSGGSPVICCKDGAAVVSTLPEGLVYVGKEGDRSYPLFSGLREPALDSAALASEKGRPSQRESVDGQIEGR